MRNFRLLISVALIVVVIGFPGIGESRASYKFSVPAKLRARVDFWKDIFTKYGKYEVVVHHRHVPQIVFDVVDMTIEGTFLEPEQFAKLKKVRVERSLRAIKNALEKLAGGAEPSTSLEHKVVQLMTPYFGKGVAKYKLALKDDLIRTQTGIREKFAESVRRSGRYIARMEAIFLQKGLPEELTRLPFIESSFDYTAYSSVGAAGIWQFMPRTAKNYMLVNSIVDQRRDPIIATYGAADYLKTAFNSLGRWPEAITSYNHGVAGVRRKMNASGKKTIEDVITDTTQNPFGFASTNFYPEFLAAVEVYRERSVHFPDVEPEATEKYVERRLPKKMSVRSAANYFGVSLEALQTVNYSFSKRVWEGYYHIPKGYIIKIPVGKVPSSRLKEQQSYSVVHGGSIIHDVRTGETLSTIASHYNVSVDELIRINSLKSSIIRVGQRLRIVSAQSPVSKKVSSTKAATSTYRVRAGDSLSTIADRFGTTISNLKALNKLPGSRILVGQSLRVPSQSQSPENQGGGAAQRIYKVDRGDSLWLIARKFGVPMRKLMELNGLKGQQLKIGQTLKIPR